jgi:hypothetical protein
LYKRTFLSDKHKQRLKKTILKATGDNYIRERAANKDLHQLVNKAILRHL